jgi:16S rRNA (cytosine967-C5)-methyltransferase
VSKDFREISLKILADVFSTRRWAKESIDANIKDIDEEHRDIKKVYELVYGVLRNKNYIDFYLSLYIKKPANDPVLQNILRMGFYQIMYMDSIPPYAAIDVSVEMTKHHVHHKTSGFVNAVLRSILREKGRGIRIKGEGKAEGKERTEYLSIKYSYEKWMVEFFLKNYKEDAEKIMAAGNEKPPVFLRVNTLKTDTDGLKRDLKAQGVETQNVKGFKNALLIVSGDPIKTPSFESGLFYVQDLASQVLGELVAAQKEEAIVDIGSAPGGKAAFFAMDSKGKAGIVAVERNEVRLKMMERNFVRLGITNVEVMKHDATVDIEAFHDRADKVIVDAPCSALGVIRRHPEKKWCLTEAELKEFPKLQSAILNTVSKWVKKGGELFYSTCTLNPAENETVIEKFLEKNDGFKLSDTVGDNAKLKAYKHGKYFRSLPGNKDNMDGFFIARLKRSK